jgi:hypothetical protein
LWFIMGSFTTISTKMKHGAKKLLCLASGIALCATPTIQGQANTGPYTGIVDRNVFGLKPPPPPPSTEPPKPPPSKITLTGIMTILGRKQALMKTPPPTTPSKPGDPPKTEQFYMLGEGQRDGEIEVVSIDEKTGTVIVKNAGTEETLNFDKNGPKLASAPAPAPGGPGLPPPPPTGGSPFVNPAPNAGGAASPLIRSIPRPMRTDGAANTGAAVQGGAAAVGGTPGINVNGTSLSFAGTGSANPGPSDQQAAQLQMASQRSPEESVLLYEANRAKNEALAQQGVHIPHMPTHPYIGGDQPPQQQISTPLQQRIPLPGRPLIPAQ